MFKTLTMTVNGKEVAVPIEEGEALLDTLRERLALTSVKRGCEVGECGACTVLVDGKAVDSCIYLSQWAEGKRILTVEGIRGENGELNPIQQAFVDEAAVQCGFCTP
ncbi:MAG: 2Fe-2S iron-sulfur cluster-binding protein, partial [Clostridia bacterium]